MPDHALLDGKPDLLLAIDFAPTSIERLREICTVHQATTPDERDALAERMGNRIRAIVTNGTTPIPGSLITALPNLGIVCAQGAGYEGVDLEAVRTREITVTNSPGANANCVADHAMALMLAVLRDVPRFDAAARAGRWREGGTMRPAAHGKRIGILGLGGIGRRIARRCTGFDMEIRYHNRRPVEDVAWTYLPTLEELCTWADIVVAALPGGLETRHMVDRAALNALGPTGFLVNVGRGSVVDTAALADALREGRLGGAGLDVIEGEPEVPASLRDLPNLVLTPHIAGRSPESMGATIAMVVANLTAFFAGDPVPNPIPEQTVRKTASGSIADQPA